MTIRDPDSADQDGDEEPRDPKLEQLLRAVSRAPVPETIPLPGLALPHALREALEAELSGLSPPHMGENVDGRYRIDDTLGSGGMGIVYAATHLATGRKVALKWMQVSSSYRTVSEREAAFQRFLREAQATGRIQHPNVVDVHDAGRDPRTPFLVMERLQGKTLRAHMHERGRLGWDEALALLLPAMAGVAEAHRCGVVHRDLKPDNVFLAQEAAGTVPKVLDFGVSRLRPSEEGVGDESSLTRTGTVLGTPAYMPLEQLRARGEVDARTDVYALGVMLFEMLAGRRPYEARNAADFAALLACEQPAPLSRYRPDLRGAREAAVMRALARRPAERPESVQAFAALLRAARPAPAYRLRAPAAALLALLVSGGLYWALRVAPQAQREPRRRVLEEAAGVQARGPELLPSSPPAGQAAAPAGVQARGPEAVPSAAGGPAVAATTSSSTEGAAVPASRASLTGSAPPGTSRGRAVRAVRSPTLAAAPTAALPPPASLPAAARGAARRSLTTRLEAADFQANDGAPQMPRAQTPEPARPSLTLGRDQF